MLEDKATKNLGASSLSYKNCSVLVPVAELSSCICCIVNNNNNLLFHYLKIGQNFVFKLLTKMRLQPYKPAAL